jgi:hypothetical protein
MTLDYPRRACARGGDSTGLDPGLSGAFRYLEKNCTFAKVHAVRFIAETDNCFRAETHNRLISERQFAASARPGVDNIAIANAFADRGPVLRRLRWTKLHGFRHFGDARLRQPLGI